MMLVPKSPETHWLESFCEPQLPSAGVYKIDEWQAACKLDQNESPMDWPLTLKRKVCNALLHKEWNRYPSPYSKELIEHVSSYTNVGSDHILLGNGSNYLITVLLSTMTNRLKGELYIARPSFPLYEQHCRTHGIPYRPWHLSQDFHYEIESLRNLKPQSIVIFASPNNPVGNVLPKSELRRLLQTHPESLFIADEAYFEFSSEPYTELLAEFGNLVLLRTLSKALGMAGLRLGYLLASKELVQLVSKVVLPFMLNHFAIAAATELFRDKVEVEKSLALVKLVKEERKRLFDGLRGFGHKIGCRVYDSEANFLLLRWTGEQACQQAYERLLAQGIQLRKLGGKPSELSHCLRLTVGSVAENDRVLEAFYQSAKCELPC